MKSTQWFAPVFFIGILLAFQNCAPMESLRIEDSRLGSSGPGDGGTTPLPPPDPEEPPFTEPNRPLETGSTLRTLSTGHNFTEGSAYHGPSNTLFFSDLEFANALDRVFALDLTTGVASVWRGQGLGTNGNVVDKQGRLYSVQARAERRVVRYDDVNDANTFTALPNTYGGLGFNAPNDVELHSSGDIYFTDPTYNGTDDGTNLVAFRGVFRIDSNGIVEPMVELGFNQPNGLAFSPNEDKMYVSDSADDLLYVFDVDPNTGLLSNRQTFYDPPVPPVGVNGGIDGIEVDLAGNIYASGAEKITILSPLGNVLVEIPVGEQTTNCTIGNKTLYINGSSSIYAIDIRIPERNRR